MQVEMEGGRGECRWRWREGGVNAGGGNTIVWPHSVCVQLDKMPRHLLQYQSKCTGSS